MINKNDKRIANLKEQLQQLEPFVEKYINLENELITLMAKKYKAAKHGKK